MPLVRLNCERRSLGRPIAAYVRDVGAAEPGVRVTVPIPETEPERLWQRLLQNQQGACNRLRCGEGPAPACAQSAQRS
ncbi:hypothetical protein AB0N31_04470 [Streptomyces sp. NPDC051051]|uniref:hypothetical protein n=1 Tax=Streptomyces sp. NPDC051051 TaxID=3155666 RepID=UPI003441D0A1